MGSFITPHVGRGLTSELHDHLRSLIGTVIFNPPSVRPPMQAGHGWHCAINPQGLSGEGHSVGSFLVLIGTVKVIIFKLLTMTVCCHCQ